MKRRKEKKIERPRIRIPRRARATNEPDEILQGPGFIMARKGRLIQIESTLTSEEYEAMLKRLSESRGDLEADIARQVAELEEVISKYDPFDIISNVWFSNAIFDAETYREYEHKGVEAYIEYVALLCLTRPYRESQEHIVPGPVVEDINNRIDALFGTVINHFVVKDISPYGQKPRDTLHELRLNTFMRSLIVGHPGYEHHQESTIRGIFSPVNTQLLELLGFDIEDALALADGVSDMLSRRINERIEQSRNSRRKLMKEVKRYRQKKRGEGSELPAQLLEQMTEMRPSEARRSITNILIAWTLFAFGDTLSFTASELANETGREVNRVQAYLENMSLQFGEVEPRYRLPSPTHPLMARPFIHHGDRFFCPVPNSLLWTIQPALESRLNPASLTAASSANTRVWEQYQEARSNYLEARSMELLNKALRHAESYRNLTYEVVDNGQVVQAELDGMLILDSALFIMEAKAGTMSLPARRGASQGMVEDLRELVGKAYEQALRAKRYIESVDKPVFHLNDGTLIEVPKQRIDKVFMVTTTLDALDAFVTSLYCSVENPATWIAIWAILRS